MADYEALEKAMKAVVNSVIEATKSFMALAKSMDLYRYPNKKVLHLALYHPKKRVRKKNLNRIRKGGK